MHSLKKLKRLGVIVATCALLLGIIPTQAAAGDYIGDFCWRYADDRGGTGIVKLGLSHMGGGHFLCSGVTSAGDPVVYQTPIHGNVEVVGGEIQLNLILAGIRNGAMGIQMVKGRLNPSTLSGTSESTGVYADKVESATGTFSFTSCP